MRIATVGIVAILLALAAPAKAKDETPQYKTAEAKHFTTAEGVELTPAFVDYFYAELRSELTKAKLAGEVIGEGEAVDEADAPQSLVITGTITEYKKGSVAKAALIGFGAGLRSLKMDADVTRRSDKQNLCVLHVHVKVDPRWNEQVMAKSAANLMVKEMKKALKEGAKPPA
ncbi:MAG TPA: DUF4410 domain-containing protein [Candidatus Solibacter sp.]|nr:DUF4410 domain-containing protein [Candidatus Acidoferrum sp.]HTQ84920.1 DUF4410 domain-containing protein [Candidatus Solibacter sp.]